MMSGFSLSPTASDVGCASEPLSLLSYSEPLYYCIVSLHSAAVVPVVVIFGVIFCGGTVEHMHMETRGGLGLCY